jgi:hypothetical protein
VFNGRHLRPSVGRLAMLTDPRGAAFYVMNGAMESTRTSFAPMRTSHCHWNELAADDQAVEVASYNNPLLLGKSDAMLVLEHPASSSPASTDHSPARGKTQLRHIPHNRP